MKDIRNYNSKGEYHGYQELYYSNTNTIGIRVNYKNGKIDGYRERYFIPGKISELKFYIL